ncbi:hypothetical protein [Bradyrhizobium guangzhouense]|uniref:Uncharacterized protein n=1 Tax=Bradyrhizobium guangzhouense TaxID=1325095 RepID=A0AAE6C8I3_9BRAD|nr:hypothetical protein [Bradyrhizobium guangzhouense]QAU46527.1 hypothetical protein XH91_14895 [Bradyrhizobium guangzhouense]RXH09379.1 hypothetical protein EAS56_25745 [Bradyrhizobium guangzhouense]
MKSWFGRTGLGRFVGDGEKRQRLQPAARVWLKRGLLWLLAASVVGGAVWRLIPSSNVAHTEPVKLALASVDTAPPTGSDTSAAEAVGLDRMKISSQTWRRGGLGSKALVTFTVRNDNDYAVKDVEIVCAFTRRDGSHLTDRSHVLADTVSMKSRKTFARVPVGFVNVNADQAKCSLVAARRA